jgi:ribosomal protein L29
MNQHKQELKSLNRSQLLEKIGELRKGILGLKLNASTAHIKDYSQFKKLRRRLACALTYLNRHDAQ